MKAERQFLVEYNHKGESWALDIWADDEADAERKLRSIGANGRIKGELCAKIRLPGPVGRFANFLNWMKNA